MEQAPVDFDTPPPPEAYVRWADRLAPLLARPGEWARVRDAWTKKDARRFVGELRKGRMHIPAGRWEFRHGEKDGRPGVWARYLGQEAG